MERVDDRPAHGEVPGTEAFSKRTQDAEPDELEVIPEGSGTDAIPKTVVEKVEPDKPSHGEVPGTEAYEKRKADAEPDQIVEAPAIAREPAEGEPLPNHLHHEEDAGLYQA